jgi:uncharacterized protein YodC (DUF2158 family)
VRRGYKKKFIGTPFEESQHPKGYRCEKGAVSKSKWNITTTNNITGCATHCDTQEGCIAFDYLSEVNGTYNCRFTDAGGVDTKNDTRRSCAKISRQPEVKFSHALEAEHAKGYNCTKGAVSKSKWNTTKTNNITGCATHCDTQEGCIAFDFLLEKNGTYNCRFTDAGGVDAKDDTRRFCEKTNLSKVVQPKNKTEESEEAKHAKAYDCKDGAASKPQERWKTTKTNSITGCATHCDEHKGCIAFDYHVDKDGVYHCRYTDKNGVDAKAGTRRFCEATKTVKRPTIVNPQADEFDMFSRAFTDGLALTTFVALLGAHLF